MLFCSKAVLLTARTTCAGIPRHVLNRGFATPTRFMNRWKWENVWALWALVAMFISSMDRCSRTAPHLFATYQGQRSGMHFCL